MCVLAVFIAAEGSGAQTLSREFSLGSVRVIEIKNLYGRVEVETEDEREGLIALSISGSKMLSDKDLRIEDENGKLRIEVLPQGPDVRVDFVVKMPPRGRVELETKEGAIHLIGDFSEARAKSSTGTIYADVSTEYLDYRFVWLASNPRFISDVALEPVREKSAGRFQIKGRLREKAKGNPVINSSSDDYAVEIPMAPVNGEIERPQGPISLDFTTARGIILLNVPPNEVPSNLRERPLTEAARAIIRSGDSLLTNSIRRASPKYFGEYAATLPPRSSMPSLSAAVNRQDSVNGTVKRVTVQVTDINNRAMLDLSKEDFSLIERNDEREILSVESTTAPFNLVLLLDVSGSIEHYVDFIRKAARNFINTTSPQDKIAIVTFNEDVNTLSDLTKDRLRLSESLDTFDAGGGTAYFDAIAYSLTETLRTLRGERTAIVVLSDGDDNRSFLSFNSLLGSIQESGALIYPLYVPSGLIAASSSNDPLKAVDPLRTRYMSLTSKAQQEGETLAKVSGGVYYPISRLSELQEAYNDIVLQLRTAYTITYRSDSDEFREERTSPRLKVKVKRESAFVKLGPVVAVGNK